MVWFRNPPPPNGQEKKKPAWPKQDRKIMRRYMSRKPIQNRRHPLEEQKVAVLWRISTTHKTQKVLKEFCAIKVSMMKRKKYWDCYGVRRVHGPVVLDSWPFPGNQYIQVLIAYKRHGNMAEWSKAPESGLTVHLVRKGEGSNPSVVITSTCSFLFILFYFFNNRSPAKF